MTLNHEPPEESTVRDHFRENLELLRRIRAGDESARTELKRREHRLGLLAREETHGTTMESRGTP